MIQVVVNPCAYRNHELQLLAQKILVKPCAYTNCCRGCCSCYCRSSRNSASWHQHASTSIPVLGSAECATDAAVTDAIDAAIAACICACPNESGRAPARISACSNESGPAPTSERSLKRLTISVIWVPKASTFSSTAATLSSFSSTAATLSSTLLYFCSVSSVPRKTSSS